MSGFWLLLATMAAASFACRAGGFFLMRFVPMTQRLDSALKATPLAVMAGITALGAIRGGWPELAGIAVALVLMRAAGHDLAAALAGVVVVALGRAML